MKRYKLLKDLPTFNKGDTFQLDEDSGCLVRENDGVVAYAPYTLEKFNLLDSEWFEEIPEHERWRAEYGETYYWLDEELSVIEETEDYGPPDDKLYAVGNYFKTEEEAQKASDWLKAFTVLRDDTKGFKPDWEDDEQDKAYVFYSHTSKTLHVCWDKEFQSRNLYFATHEDAEASIKNHEREWLTFFGVEE